VSEEIYNKTIMKFNHSTLSIIAAAFFAPAHLVVDAHGYLKSPKSRNYYAGTDGKWYGGTASDPARENCPHCLNRGGTDGVCGISSTANYEQPPNAMGGLMPPVVQACYSPGSVVEFESVLTAHHKGHFEFRACPVSSGEVPTQECFDSNLLTFVEDPLYGAVPDPNHPERAYIPNAGVSPWTYKHRYQLPSNLEGELVIIQWYYLTANSCNPEGYGDYNFAPLGISGNSLAQCGYPLPSNGVPGVPEQFWNCAEVKISTDCGTTPFPTKQPSVPVTTSPVAVSTPRPTISNAPTFNNAVPTKQPSVPITKSPVTVSTSRPTISNAPTFKSVVAESREDSRLIAYLANWQACPTDDMLDAYTHIVIAFAVSYTWSAAKNNCDTSCSVSAPPTCGNQVRQDLIDKWQGQGKKVVLSFGGAGMGGSWPGDSNNCWDYCFGKEDKVSTQLMSIVQKQNLDGIDLDYEYCYDTEGTQSGMCTAKDTSLFPTKASFDTAAQNFLTGITSNLRQKMDALGDNYELTHAPMDSDLAPTSKYYQILKDQNENLNYLMPQFYNGYIKVVSDGFTGTGAGAYSAESVYSNLAMDLFPNRPEKVVFGFCVNGCGGTGSNANGQQAVSVLQQVKEFDQGQYSCNGGAFFWVASADASGSWSDPVAAELALTAGCLDGTTPPTPSPQTTTPNPTTSIAPRPTRPNTSQPTDSPPTTTTSPSSSVIPQPTRPNTSQPTDVVTSEPTRETTPPSTSPPTVTPNPTRSVTPSPTISKAPTFKEPVTSKPTNAPIEVGPSFAVFDAALGAPRCASAASSCESGDLLKGSSCSEPNGSNSVDECVDGSRAIQSIERISVASLSGEVFQEGDMVAIAADVHAWVDGQSNVTVDIYHAVSASYPIWNLVHSEVVNGGMATVRANHGLPGGSPTQAFRFNIRHGGKPETGCSGGQWDDVDDLILHVEPEVITTTTTTTPPRVKARRALFDRYVM